jgi:hypothetical protein
VAKPKGFHLEPKSYSDGAGFNSEQVQQLDAIPPLGVADTKGTNRNGHLRAVAFFQN